jgi:hypothetical protein
MNIWNRVFLGIIFVTAIVVFVLAALEFQIRNKGQEYTVKKTKEIEATEAKIAKIKSGTDPMKLLPDKSLSDWSLDELKGVLRERFYERGRAWFGCIVAGMEERTLPPALQQVVAQVVITGPFMPGEAGVETDVVPPESLKGVVYVFAEGDENELEFFLGRFHVNSEPTPTKFPDSEGNEKNGYRVALITKDTISDAEIEQIYSVTKADSRWAIYMAPPMDRVAGIFDQLTEDEKQAMPDELREKLQPRPMPELEPEDLEGVDPKIAEIWKNYRLQWDNPESDFAQDFSAVLDWLYQYRSSIHRDIEETKASIVKYQVSVEKNEAENKKKEEEIAREEKRVSAMEKQRDAVKTLFEQYEAEVNKMRLQMEKMQALAEAYVAKITEYQLMAVEKIESREEKPAQREEIGVRR